MTIRYTCEECGSVLNIKDEKAGTQGKCPKCKTEFLVPSPDADETAPANATVEASGSEPDSSHELLASGSDQASSGDSDRSRQGSDDFSDDEIERILETEEKKKESKKKPARGGDDYGVSAGLDDDDDEDDDELDAPDDDEEPLALKARRRKPVDFDDDDDDDDDEDDRPSRKSKGKPARGEPASTSAGLAKGLMARGEKGTGGKEERRSKRLFGAGGEHEGDEDDGDFTLKDKASYLAKFAVPAVVVLIVTIGIYMWYMRGWRRGDLPELGSVTGVVTLDGKPLAKAEIQYFPQLGDPNKPNLNISSSGGITNDNGEFELTYTAYAQGAVLGKHRVQIICYDKEGKQLVPANFNVRSELYREVKAGSNKEVFELKSSKEDSQSSVGGFNPNP